MIFEKIESTGSIIPIPENVKDCIELMRSDFYRAYGKKFSLTKMFFISFIEPSLKFMFWHRLTQVKWWGWYFAKWRHRHYMFKYGLLIASSTKIGYGFLIGHPYGIIINHTAIIGNNVNLSQFTTIGTNENHAAIIGDCVYIGPSCQLIDDIVVGSNVTIGAGSVVPKSIPANTVAVGNPARVIKEFVHPKYINNIWFF